MKKGFTKFAAMLLFVVMALTVSACNIRLTSYEKTTDTDKLLATGGDEDKLDDGIEIKRVSVTSYNEILPTHECHADIGVSENYYDNLSESSTAYNEALSYFTSDNETFSEDWGGAYIDGNGIYNVCVVGDRQPVQSDYLVYVRVNNSYNYLKSVYNAISAIMKDYGISCVDICTKCNKLLIAIKDENNINLLTGYLKSSGLFKNDTLVFYVGTTDIVPNIEADGENLKTGTFYGLQEAYEKGKITKQDLVSIADKHNNLIISGNNGAKATVSDEQFSELQNAYNKQFSHNPSILRPVTIMEYLGEYSGLIIVIMVFSDVQYPAVEMTAVIDGVIINYPYPLELIAYDKNAE